MSAARNGPPADPAAPKPPGPMERVKAELMAAAPQFKAVLPKSVGVERFVQVCMMAAAGNIKLAEAVTSSAFSKRTFFAACAKCAQDGLIPDGREAALTYFKNNREQGALQIQYMPMIQGVLKKVRNSGEIRDIGAYVVHAKDQFSYELGDNPHIRHVPADGDRGPPIKVYAVCRTKDGGVYREVLTEAEVKAVASVSRATGDDSPWNGPFKLEMWRKTALRRLSKVLPLSSDATNVIHADDDLFGVTAEDPPADPPEPPAAKPRAANKLRDAVLGEGAGDGQPPPEDGGNNSDVPI